MAEDRRVVTATTVAVVCVALLVGCTSSPPSDPASSATDDEVTVGQFEELSGFAIPASATAVAVEPVSGSSVGAVRARLTIPEDDLAPFCGTPLPLDGPFTDQARQTFALSDDLSAEQARDCEPMRPGTNVSRRVIVAPADGQQVRVHVVVFDMPR